ncbi:MAG: hypothetical protein MJ175_03685, partial [Clostridia bacterium]|nr:hypothetical protein [Clostridia bacterium]
TMMARMASVEGNKIRVGLCSYDYVVIPDFDTIDANTAELVKTFLANGGKVWCYGNIPTRIDGRTADTSFIKSTVTFEEIKAAADSILKADDQDSFRQMVRNTEDGKLVYIVNLGGKDVKDAEISVAGVTGMEEIDLNTLETKPVPGTVKDGRFVFSADFVPAASHLYVESTAAALSVADKTAPAEIVLDKPFTFAEMPENQLTLDHFAVSFDGGKTFTEQRPLERIRDNLLRAKYHGSVTLKAVFTVDEIPADLTLCTETTKGAVYTVNGTPVLMNGAWWLDRSFRTADIKPLVKVGENEITMTFDYWQRDYVYYVLYGGVSESLRNCLDFDTEIECMYLKGHFALNTPGTFNDDVRSSCTYVGPFSVTAQKSDVINPNNIVREGYPFFAGSVSVKTAYTYKAGDPTMLFVRGRYATCKVSVNGKDAAMLMFTDRCDLKDFLCEGENEITLTLTNSNRNLLGPHHGHDPEPYGVGPGTFSMENQWHDGECGAYVDRYAFVRFGFDTAK